MRTYRVELNGKVAGPTFQYEDDAHWWVRHWHSGERYTMVTLGGIRPWRVDYLSNGMRAPRRPSKLSLRRG